LNVKADDFATNKGGSYTCKELGKDFGVSSSPQTMCEVHKDKKNGKYVSNYNRIRAKTSNALGGNAFYFKVEGDDVDGTSNPPKKERARAEIKVSTKSDSKWQAKEDDTHTYEWEFYIPSGFKLEKNQFNHIFQIKPQGGDAQAPLITLSLEKRDTRRNGKTVTVEKAFVRYDEKSGDGGPERIKDSEIDFSKIKGTRVKAKVKVKYSDKGYIDFELRAKGKNLMDFRADRDFWRDGVTIQRPKWGLYRSHKGSRDDETIQFKYFKINNGK